ncbi:hypothetical protein OAF27_02370 [Verrucomicrobiales bacterium]|nr:hypothetical protein [Verrucomicrobiales bacterium]
MQKHFLKVSGCCVSSAVRSAVRETSGRRFDLREKSGAEFYRETLYEAGMERKADARRWKKQIHAVQEVDSRRQWNIVRVEFAPLFESLTH